MKLRLAGVSVRSARSEGFLKAAAAKLVRSSQSRVAKMETGDDRLHCPGNQLITNCDSSLPTVSHGELSPRNYDEPD